MCKKIYREYTYYDEMGNECAWYEANEEELVDGLVDIFYYEYFEEKFKKVDCPISIVVKTKDCLREMIDNEIDLEKKVDWYREELKEYFEEKARE